MLNGDLLRAARSRYAAVLEGPPLTEHDVTDAQLTALSWMNSAGLGIHADFGVFGPYGQRKERKMKFMNHFMDSSGRWQQCEQRGPSCLEEWRACWERFSIAATMLSIAFQSTLKHYSSRFEAREARFLGAWHLAVTVEDRSRADQFLVVKRNQDEFKSAHPELSAYNKDKPWDTVIRAVANDADYWGREFQEPALRYTLERVSVNQGGQQQLGGNHDRGQKRPREEPGAKVKNHWRGTCRKDNEGLEICFNSNRGDGCSEPCPNGRSHLCEYCLGSRRGKEEQCPASQAAASASSKGKGKKGRKGKG